MEDRGILSIVSSALGWCHSPYTPKTSSVISKKSKYIVAAIKTTFSSLPNSSYFFSGNQMSFNWLTLPGAVVAVIVWYLDLQLPMQVVPITTDVVSSNLGQGAVYDKCDNVCQ